MKLNRHKALLIILTIAMKTMAMGEDFGQYMSVTTEYEQPVQQKAYAPLTYQPATYKSLPSQQYIQTPRKIREKEYLGCRIHKRKSFNEGRYSECEGYNNISKTADLTEETNRLKQQLMSRQDKTAIIHRPTFWSWLKRQVVSDKQFIENRKQEIANYTNDRTWKEAYNAGLISNASLKQKRILGFPNKIVLKDSGEPLEEFVSKREFYDLIIR